ncbi:MAG: DUF4093 domain-containing protein [Dehalobacter sp.]|nr:DUF4093 domain-containing protein [Dehalobacter sp.]
MNFNTNTGLDYEPLIVVEGKNDAHAVRRALGKVDVIWTEGFGLTEQKLEYIAEMAERRGVIVCTDPDFAGKQIRERINKRIPKARHVYLSVEVARNPKDHDIGLENVSSEEIRKAFSKILEVKISNMDSNDGVKIAEKMNTEAVVMADLRQSGLVGQSCSAARRSRLGRILGIGDTNAKQFLFRVNRFGITKDEFYSAVKQMEGNGK